MKNLSKYSVEIINDEYHLSEAFALRYKVNSIKHPSAVAHLKQPFDCDVYDKRSIHIGLFEKQNGNKKLAGYARLILPQAYKHQYKQLLFEKHACYKYIDAFADEERLPLINLLPFGSFIKTNNHCFLLETKGDVYAELNNSLFDGHLYSLVMLEFFTSGINALVQLLEIDFCFMSCDVNHAMFFAKAGYCPFPLANVYKNTLLSRTDVIIGANTKSQLQLSPLGKLLKMQWDVEKQMTYELAA